MSTIERHIPGTPTWVELMTHDLEGARRFYGELFGWTFEGGDDPQTGHYMMCKAGGRNAAGIGKMPEGGSPQPAWGIYFEGEDVDQLAESIRANGGQVMLGPMDVMEFGRMLIATDPTGAVFGVWQSKTHTGAQAVEEPGAMIWHEVNTRDHKRAADFYGRVLGLEARKLEDPNIEYMTLHKGEKAVGGVLQMDEQWPAELPPHWMNYFAVSDVDASAAKVEALGGKVQVQPFDTPHGRLAVVADPSGAVFSIITPSEPAK
jgi:predicted enzyme related to lactoylglutathione lyase